MMKYAYVDHEYIVEADTIERSFGLALSKKPKNKVHPANTFSWDQISPANALRTSSAPGVSFPEAGSGISPRLTARSTRSCWACELRIRRPSCGMTYQ